MPCNVMLRLRWLTQASSLAINTGSSPTSSGSVSYTHLDVYKRQAAGIVVAVPAMIAYRYYRSKVDDLLVGMEQQAIKLVEIIHGERG